METLGMQKFRKVRSSAEPEYYDLNVGQINVHKVVKKKIDFIRKKYGDSKKWGGNAIDSDAKAVILMLEEFCTPKKRAKRKKEPPKK